jgi:hypothetical protein
MRGEGEPAQDKAKGKKPGNDFVADRECHDTHPFKVAGF